MKIKTLKLRNVYDIDHHFDDVSRIVQVFLDRNYKIDFFDAKEAWRRYSCGDDKSLANLWHRLPSDDQVLFDILINKFIEHREEWR